MQRIFIETKEFSKRWKILGMTEDDLKELQEYLLLKPDAGVVMKGTGGLRKIRWAKNKGKSGGVRTLYIDFSTEERIYLVTVFGKKEKDNLTNEEKNNIRSFIKNLLK